MLENPDEIEEIREIAITLSMNAMREKVYQELRDSLKSDPTIIDEVKRELKRQIMGL